MFGLDVPGIISKLGPSTSGCLFLRDLWFKPYTEQSQYGLPLRPFVVILSANEPLSSPPAQILTAAALLQPDQLSLVQAIPGQLLLVSQQCWTRGLPPAGEDQEDLLSASTATLLKKKARGRDCRGRILHVHGLYRITLHFFA